MRLILIRHGQTPANVGHIIETTIPGPGLTTLGIEQAESIPGALASENVDSISVSRMVRTHFTAAPLARVLGIAPVERPGLHEVEAGELEGFSDEASMRAYLAPFVKWADGDLHARIPGAGDGHEFYERFDADVAEIARSGARTAVIVSHGAAIRAWVGGRGGNIDPHFTVEHRLDNTGIAIMVGSPTDGWELESWQGVAIGGPAVSDSESSGPAGEPVEVGAV